MKTKMKYLIFAVSFSWMSSALAYNHDFVKPKGGGDQTPKAGCAPSNERLTMNFNDVSALLETGGMLFLNRANGTAAYEVPKGGGVTAIYAGSLWMGGTDNQGQLRLAAALFRQGNDFTSGPLDELANPGNYDPSGPVGDNAIRPFGGASVSADQCLEYDKFFTIRKAEVIYFNNWWECDKGIQTGPECEGLELSADLRKRITEWPAHGEGGQDPFLAPFYDRDPDGVGPEGPNGIYDPFMDGDYPWYDDILGRNDIVCGDDRRVSLFGDETHWWVFNDQGSIHTESGGEPIGMEIRAQAFTFTTNDEVNRMTFYNYELINRSTYELIDTYFAQYVDADLGGSPDDYVGCDVTRGLGYAFNGDNFDDDANGKPGYGSNPPAIGIDFFEGPYQDADQRDNVLATGPGAVQAALADSGIVYPGLGVGYGDGIIDNERYGMRRFNYYTGTAAANQSDPSTAAQFYNYMSGFWRFGDEMVYGGTGFPGSSGSTTILSNYMFPGDSDSLHWGTGGVDPGFTGNDWSELTANNAKGDRRFVQSAGPFTLKPGAVNNITVGIVYARSAEGDLFASVRSLKRADTKAQALFDNCFKILDPPPAPVLTIQELENEVILMLSNPVGKNKNEAYEEIDEINIPEEFADRSYRFEGYQIYQMVNEDASAADVGDVDKARLVAQCDLKNNIGNLINFEFDEALGMSIPTEKVRAANQGIRHSFRITEDQFAQGSRTLVNHKSYYYIAIAYAYNQFKEYNPNDPTKLDGQKIPYISSRNNGDGSPITSKQAIPHSVQPELGGTIQNVGYGSTPQITRLDGRGNGNRSLELTKASVDYIVQNGTMQNPTYDYGSGPLNIKVVDPLNLAGGYFVCKFRDYPQIANEANNSINGAGVDTAKWTIQRYSDKNMTTLLDEVSSERAINSSNEQIIAKWGVSVQIYQEQYYFNGTTGNEFIRFTDPISSSIEFGDSSKRWLTTINDNDGILPENWIRSGNFKPNAATECNDELGIYNPCCYNDELNIDDPIDPDKKYAKLLSGGIAPYRLVGYQCAFMPLAYPSFYTSYTTSRERNSISRAPSIDIVITEDRTKWTRCAVIELGRDEALNIGGAKPGTLRRSPSLDQNGNEIAGSTGMSWFPGYAIDLETGARLHMAFGENSFLASENGSDMKWNPTSRRYDNQGNPLFGGQHPIYVYGVNILGNPDATKNAPAYDGVNNWVYDKMKIETSASYADVYSSLTWIANTILAPNQELRSTDVKIKVRINKEYNDYNATGLNGGRPMYGWSMDGISTTTGVKDQLADALKLINVVPNPYYAFSSYERGRLDTRVKITNLPDRCNIKIYNVSGKLIRSFKKDSPITSLDWDMKNGVGIPIASGIYLIHVEVPDVGEVVLKFFGGVRAVDLENI